MYRLLARLLCDGAGGAGGVAVSGPRGAGAGACDQLIEMAPWEWSKRPLLFRQSLYRPAHSALEYCPNYWSARPPARTHHRRQHLPAIRLRHVGVQLEMSEEHLDLLGRVSLGSCGDRR
jgi:hypothetical protein